MQLAATLPKRWRPIAALALVVATLLAYSPVLDAGFIWDDDAHVLAGTDLTDVDGLARIWFEIGATQQYYPVVYSSFWIENQFFGAAPGGYHLSNVLLHAANALLLGLLLEVLLVPGAWLAAAIFALHPVHVESVAWVSERKNVLSMAFYLLSMLTYLRFRAAHGEPGRRALYIGAFALFLLAVLSKTVVASLPAAVLLIVWWKHGRLARADWLPLLPFFAVAIAVGSITLLVEKQDVGAFGPAWELSAIERLLVAGRATLFYSGKLLWPTDLTFIYPRWEIEGSNAQQYLYPLIALAIVIGLWLRRETIGRGPLVAALFFGGTLVPALGFFDVYPFLFSYVADHFQYLASASVIALIAACVAIASRYVASSPVARVPGFAMSLLVLAGLGGLTHSQAATYHDARTLWQTTLERNPNAWLAHHNLGVIDLAEGRTEQGLARINRAIELNPNYADAYNNRGTIYLGRGEVDRAIAEFTLAVESQSDHLLARTNRAGAYHQVGHGDLALADLERVVEIAPDYPKAYLNLAAAYYRANRFELAIETYGRAIALTPEEGDAYWQRCECLRQLGRHDEALADCNAGVDLDPTDGRANMRRAMVLLALGRVDEARVDVRAGQSKGVVMPESLIEAVAE